MRMNEEEVLLKERDVFIRLYIHEDRVCWNLISLFVAVNVGLASAFAAIVSWQNIQFNLLLTISVVALVGFVANLMGVALFYRNKIYRKSRLSDVLTIENKMKEKGITVETVEVCEEKILNSEENRFLKWLKRRGNLDKAHRWPFAIAIIWLIPFSFSALKYLGILRF